MASVPARDPRGVAPRPDQWFSRVAAPPVRPLPYRVHSLSLPSLLVAVANATHALPSRSVYQQTREQHPSTHQWPGQHLTMHSRASFSHHSRTRRHHRNGTQQYMVRMQRMFVLWQIQVVRIKRTDTRLRTRLSVVKPHCGVNILRRPSSWQTTVAGLALPIP